jgi:hypothetical protein
MSKDYVALIRELNDLVKKHKDAPVEFSRKGKFVICTDDYRIRAITTEQLRKYIEMTKSFIDEMETMVNRNDRL